MGFIYEKTPEDMETKAHTIHQCAIHKTTKVHTEVKKQKGPEAVLHLYNVSNTTDYIEFLEK
ncbi:MAG: hypothetical protein ACMXYA_01220 [Candidatus Woesearchaeota archaeon]